MSPGNVGFSFDDRSLLHEPPSWHPDMPGRLISVVVALKAAGLWDRLMRLPPRLATEAELGLVHNREHIQRMQSMGAGAVDEDTYLSAGSYEAALAAAGAVLEAVDQCGYGEMRRVFCAVRPPGHHAEANRAMGFCLFNNVAVGARYARTRGFERVFIIDFDAHHGNGTQHIFEEDDRVFYFSTHQHPYYPDTGKDGERGRGAGEGYTYNVPMPAGSGDRDYLMIYQDILPGVVRRFEPDLVLVSAGYDIHVRDPHANIRVTTEGIVGIVRSILDCSQAPVIFVLEGGYEITSLCDAVRSTVTEMLKQ
jgi:acetoin utilization deacetylase AcuC-like enzyme